MRMHFFIVTVLILFVLPVVVADSESYTYDANGNLISGDGFFRVYDDYNNLVEIRNGSNSSDPLLEVLVWHPVESRVLFKDVYANSVWIETVFYINQNFVQIENASGKFNFTYVYQDDILTSVQESSGRTLFVHVDRTESPVVVTDENGTVIETTIYDPWGGIVEGGVTSRFDYEGKEQDTVIGDYDFSSRRYDQEKKMFTQPDLEIPDEYDPQSLNRYAFERNNPQRYTDPDGRFYKEITDAASAIIWTTHFRNKYNDLISRTDDSELQSYLEQRKETILNDIYSQSDFLNWIPGYSSTTGVSLSVGVDFNFADVAYQQDYNILLDVESYNLIQSYNEKADHSYIKSFAGYDVEKVIRGKDYVRIDYVDDEGNEKHRVIRDDTKKPTLPRVPTHPRGGLTA